MACRLKRMRSALVFAAAFIMVTVGCLDFGDNIETEEPTAEQLAFCEAEMHLNDQLTYCPIGLRIAGSGIDDAAWFAFHTDETCLENIFDPSFILLDSLPGVVSFYSPGNMPEWWDAHEKELIGGEFSLPVGQFITIGFEVEEEKTTVYIFWCET